MAKRWYVLHVYSGFEKKIALQIKEQAELKGLADRIGETFQLRLFLDLRGDLLLESRIDM